MYNVKLMNYYGGQQLKIYKYPIESGKTRKVKKEVQEEPEQLEIDLYKQEIKESKRYKDKLIEKEEKRKRSIQENTKRSKNKIYSIARSNGWDYFITLTFNKDKVNRYSYIECVKKLKIWIDRIRRTNKDIKYLIVPEQHKDGAYHFHGLISNCPNLKMVDSLKRDLSGNIIYNIKSYNLGFTTATKVQDTLKVSSYICKYITKDLYNSIPTGKKRYWYSRNIKIQEFKLLLDKDTIESYYKSGQISHISRVRNEYNQIDYLEINTDEQEKIEQFKKENSKAYKWFIDTFGDDMKIVMK